MLVLRTVCTTDWKGRPDHQVVLICSIPFGSSESRSILTSLRTHAVAAMDKDILKWMVADIASQELLAMNEDDEGSLALVPDENWESHRASELLLTKTPDAIEKMWADTGESRWEMQIEDQFSRKFVEKIGDSDLCTTVYHLLTDDLRYIESIA